MSAGFLARTINGLLRPRTLTAGAGITITNPTGDAGNPTISASGSSGIVTPVLFNDSDFQFDPNIIPVRQADQPQISSGTWIATDGSGAGLTITQTFTTNPWLRIGNLLFITCGIQYPVTANGVGAQLGGLPFPAATGQFGLTIAYTTYAGGTFISFVYNAAPTNIFLYTPAGAAITNANLSGAHVRVSGCYLV